MRRTNVAVERSGIVTFWDAMPPVANLFVTAIVIVGDGSVQELRMASVLTGQMRIRQGTCGRRLD